MTNPFPPVILNTTIPSFQLLSQLYQFINNIIKFSDLGASIINALFSTILGYLAPGLGPLANVLSITIGGIIDIAIAVVIIVSLWVILFGIGYFKL